jgi:hypothetical protein
VGSAQLACMRSSLMKYVIAFTIIKSDLNHFGNNNLLANTQNMAQVSTIISVQQFVTDLNYTRSIFYESYS